MTEAKYKKKKFLFGFQQTIEEEKLNHREAEFIGNENWLFNILELKLLKKNDLEEF